MSSYCLLAVISHLSGWNGLQWSVVLPGDMLCPPPVCPHFFFPVLFILLFKHVLWAHASWLQLGHLFSDSVGSTSFSAGRHKKVNPTDRETVCPSFSTTSHVGPHSCAWHLILSSELAPQHWADQSCNFWSLNMAHKFYTVTNKICIWIWS